MIRRMRHNRSDWDEFTQSRKRRELVGRKALYGGVDALSDEERALLSSPDTPRARPVQHERREMERLALLVSYGPGEDGVAPWWAPGFERWEARTTNDGETLQSWREGASPGWPDCGLFVPIHRSGKADVNPDAQFIICAVCEMKTERHRPKRDVPAYWWLQPWPGEQQSWHGLAREQHRKLVRLHGCGFATWVAYSAEDAYAWFDSLAGPAPEVLPW